MEKDVHGLSWSDENDIGFEGLDVNSIGFDDGECVVGDAEEELVVECCIDQSE